MEYVFVVGWLILKMVLGFLVLGVNGEGKVDMFLVFGVDYWYIMFYYCVCVVNNKVV